MGVEGIGRGLGEALIGALVIAFLAGAGCVGVGVAAYKWFPWKVEIHGR